MEYVFFDLDGTLIDSQAGIGNCIRYALQRMEIEEPVNMVTSKYIGPPLHESFAELIPDSTPERVARAVGLYRERYQKEGMFEASLYDDVPQMLETLQNNGWEPYVVTSKPTLYARQIIAHFALNRFFRRVHGSELNGALARKERLIRHVLKSEGIFHGEAVMVGDRVHDILGAKVNYLKSIGVTYGFGSREELLTAGADWICDSPAELLETLTKINTIPASSGQ